MIARRLLLVALSLPAVLRFPTHPVQKMAMTCPGPSSPGVNVCVPVQAHTYASPVSISGTGTGSSANRVEHMELWVDGHKIGIYPGRHVDLELPLAPGPHEATLVVVNVDGSYFKSDPVGFVVR
jgi:hypothetical protein